MQWASGSHSNSSVNSSAIVALYLDLTSPSNPYIWFIVILSWLPSVCGKGEKEEGEGEKILMKITTYYSSIANVNKHNDIYIVTGTFLTTLYQTKFWGIVDDIIPILPPNVYTSPYTNRQQHVGYSCTS